MNPRIERLHDWWQAREPRERWMLGLMLVALVAFLYWYAAWMPLRHARDNAARQHEQAQFELARSRAELTQLARLLPRLATYPADAATLKQAVLDNAGHAGLAIDRQQANANGLRVETDAATPAQLFAWLDALRAQHGLAPDRLSVARNGGQLRVQADFQQAD